MNDPQNNLLEMTDAKFSRIKFTYFLVVNSEFFWAMFPSVFFSQCFLTTSFLPGTTKYLIPQPKHFFKNNSRCVILNHIPFSTPVKLYF